MDLDEKDYYFCIFFRVHTAPFRECMRDCSSILNTGGQKALLTRVRSENGCCPDMGPQQSVQAIPTPHQSANTRIRCSLPMWRYRLDWPCELSGSQQATDEIVDQPQILVTVSGDGIAFVSPDSDTLSLGI